MARRSYMLFLVLLASCSGAGDIAGPNETSRSIVVRDEGERKLFTVAVRFPAADMMDFEKGAINRVHGVYEMTFLSGSQDNKEVIDLQTFYRECQGEGRTGLKCVLSRDIQRDGMGEFPPPPPRTFYSLSLTGELDVADYDVGLEYSFAGGGPKLRGEFVVVGFGDMRVVGHFWFDRDMWGGASPSQNRKAKKLIP